MEMASRTKYENNFKEESVKLALEIGTSKAARNLGIPENTLRNWLKNKEIRPERPFVGSGNKYVSQDEYEKAKIMKENKELKRANEILKEAMSFFVQSWKK